MTAVPYCGVAPLPPEVWTRWNTDPVLGLALTLALALALSRRAGCCDGRDAALRIGGWLVLVVAFVSPLCALGSALFSARIVHHALMIAVAAPLLAMAGVRVWPWRSTGGLLSAATLVHGAAIWIVHAPAVYEAALSSSAVYWATELVLLASALVFWQAVLDRGAPIGGAILALLATTMHMGLLGALLTFAGDPLYAPHAETTMAFGLSAIEDQQLGGLVMWIPAALPYLIGALTLTALALRSATGPAAARR